MFKVTKVTVEKGELLGSLGLRALWDHGGLKASKEIRDRPELQETPANPSILLSQWADGSPFTALTTTRPWSSTPSSWTPPNISTCLLESTAAKSQESTSSMWTSTRGTSRRRTCTSCRTTARRPSSTLSPATAPSCKARASCCLYRRETRSGSVSTNVSVRTPSIATMWTSTSPLTDTSSNQKLSERDIHGHEVWKCAKMFDQWSSFNKNEKQPNISY